MQNINPLFIILSLLVILILYMRAQSKVNLVDQSFFQVIWNEQVKVIREKTDELIIKWQESLKPIRIFKSESPNTAAQKEELQPPAEEDQYAVNGIDPAVRPFFEIQFMEQPKRVIAERILPLKQIHNFRDAGGYQTARGEQVAWGKLFRSGHLGSPSKSDEEYLQKLGIRSVLDLRDEVEISERPDVINFNAKYEHIFVAHRRMVTAMAVFFRRQLLLKQFVESYKTAILDQGAQSIGRIVKHLSEPENLPAILHCTAGKDRTGVSIAIILLALGVPEKTVIEDYTLSNLAAQQVINDTKKRIAKVRWLGFKVEQFYPLIVTPAWFIQSTIDYMNQQYGSVEEYLLSAAGLEPAHLENLRKNLITA